MQPTIVYYHTVVNKNKYAEEKHPLSQPIEHKNEYNPSGREGGRLSLG